MGIAADESGLVDRLAETIRARIMSGELASGERLRQTALAGEFGVSRTPVREALRQLQTAGLVLVQPNRGAIVHAPTSRDVRDAYAVRAELEGLAAEAAVPQIQDAQLELLRAAEDLFRRSIQEVIEDGQRGVTHHWSAESDWEQANNQFHQVIIEAADNRQLLATIAHLHQSFPRVLTWTALSTSSRLLEENVGQHHRVLQAIERRDAGGARREMTAHVLAAGELVARLMERR